MVIYIFKIGVDIVGNENEYEYEYETNEYGYEDGNKIGDLGTDATDAYTVIDYEGECSLHVFTKKSLKQHIR